jgi:hypothetical protein
VSLPRARWEILCILAIHVRSSYVVDYVRLPLGLSTWVDPLTPAPRPPWGRGEGVRGSNPTRSKPRRWIQ